MNNLARYDYSSDVDQKVKEELQIANIPIFQLPNYMNTEVKTKYIGILNGFVFYRAWTYWVCEGDVPLEVANNIYKNYNELLIRAGGHCGNVEPEEESYNPIYDGELKTLLEKVGIKEYMKSADKIVDDKSLPRYVAVYHIDTQLGLCKLVQEIKENNLQVEFLKD